MDSERRERKGNHFKIWVSHPSPSLVINSLMMKRNKTQTASRRAFSLQQPSFLSLQLCFVFIRAKFTTDGLLYAETKPQNTL